MLAEKRYKQKWSEDPRNTRWSEDRSKFGYRMLERMGWTEGRGLGKDLAGRTEHVKVPKRSNNSGVGYVRGRDDEWIDHQESFDQLLANLNAKKNNGGVGSGDGEAKSLMNNAINSGRAVYKKVLRSKDLSSAKSEDLDCVFGRRGRKERERREKRGVGNDEEEEEEETWSEERRSTKRSKIKSTEPEQLTAEESFPVVSHGIATITRTATIHEYFATKLTKSPTRSAGSSCSKEGKISHQCCEEDEKLARNRKRKKARAKP